MSPYRKSLSLLLIFLLGWINFSNILLPWNTSPAQAAPPVATGPRAAEAPAAQVDSACQLLDDPVLRRRLSGAFETRLLYECGRFTPGPPSPGGSPTPADLPQLGPDVRVNAIDPEIFSTTQSETSIALNEDTGTLCSSWNDSYHYFGQGTGVAGFGRSTDDGATWQDGGYFPAGAGSYSLGDPSVVWRRADGYFYYTSLHDNGLGLWRSTDDCATFEWVGMVHSGSGDDKELMAVDNDPDSPYYGRFYVAWSDFYSSTRIRLVYSDDGTTWNGPVNLSDPGADVQGAWPAVAPGGDVYVAWVRWISSDLMSMEVVRSTDGGGSFSSVTNPASYVTVPYDDGATAWCGRAALNGHIRYLPSPQIVAGPDGCLHTTYPYDPDGHGSGDVINAYYRRSCDHGASWGPEVQLNDDGTLTDQFFPAITVNADNVVAASWYDRRLDPADNLLFDRYWTVSYDGGDTWEANERVSDVSSPVYIDPYMSTCYHGDYDQMAADRSFVYVQWSDDRVFFNGHYDPDIWFDRADLPLQPALVVEPALLTATLHPEEQLTRTLWITNAGTAELTFTLREMSRTVGGASPLPPGLRPPPFPAPNFGRGEGGLGGMGRGLTRPRSEPVVDPAVWGQVQREGQARVLIYLGEQADLSPAYAMADWEARGRFVYERLVETAQRSGGDLYAWLEEAAPGGAAAPDGADVDPYRLWINNAIVATVDAAMLAEIAGRPEVARIGSNSALAVPAFRPDRSWRPVRSEGDAVEWNIHKIRADEAWATFGVTGTGAVVGDVGTGVLYTHAAIVEQYRGNLGGGTYDHDYNWFDVINSQPEPYDNVGISTYDAGIMAGDDGGANQIGVAPGAQWIAFKACNTSCATADLHAGLQWMLAPTNLGGTDPDPSKRPHVGMNPWGGASCNEFLADLQAWQAAGILPVFPPGSSGPGCGTIAAPASLAQAFSAGATDANDDISAFSSRGPSPCDGGIKPDVAAPGVSVRSSWNDGDYITLESTTPSSAHLAGTAALVLSADPALSVLEVRTIIEETALCIEDLSCGGDPCPGCNNVYGCGRIDAFEAVSMTLGGPPGFDLPWLSEDPVSGTLQPGEGTAIDVIFDSAGLTPSIYVGLLQVESNDPANPAVDVPVTLTVLPPCEPVTGTAFTWTPLTPAVGEVVTFTGSATGTAPIAYTWDLGTGGLGMGQSITHVYTVAGAYEVVLTASNACGQQVVSDTVTVVPACVPVTATDFAWEPLTPTVGEPVTFTAWASAGWLAETVDSGGGERGYFTSLALDSAGRPHISYLHYETANLLYAHHGGFSRAESPSVPSSGWQIETVDNVGSVDIGSDTSLALDAAGHPHIGYSYSPTLELRYAHYDGTGWYTETVDRYAGLHASLALDSAGRPHVSHAVIAPPNVNVVYSHQVLTPTPPITFTWDLGDGTTAQGEVIDHGYTQPGTYTVHLTATNCQGSGMATATHTITVLPPCEPVHDAAFTWAPITPAVGEVVTFTGSATGTAPITYTWDLGIGGLGMGQSITHVYTVAGAYEVVLTATNECGEEVVTHTLTASPPACEPVEGADFDWTPLTPTVDEVVTFTGTAWAYGWLTETVDSQGTRFYPYLAVDSLGRPHMAYGTFWPGDLVYAHHDGTAWQTETVVLTNVQSFTPLALDQHDHPHIIYAEQWQNPLLRYIHHDGQEWQSEIVPTAGSCGTPALALDGAGRPHIADGVAVGEYNCGDQVYIYHDGSSWVTHTVDTGWTAFSALALDTDGNPHIVYYVQGEGVHYAHYDGITWTRHLVDSTHTCFRNSLALDAQDHPHILYENCPIDLRYAWYDGTAWQTEVVDGYGLGAVVVGDLPGRAGAGHPHIAYGDKEGRYLKYGYRDGAGWHLEVVDPWLAAPSYDFGWASLALDAAEHPHIGYFGTVDGMPSLLYAHRQIGAPTPPITYSWDLGTGKLGFGAEVTQVYTVTGDYLVVLTATNGCGQEVVSDTVTVVEACVPVTGTSFAWEPYTPTAGQVVTFSGSATGTAPIDYAWDWGDGLTGTGQVATHVFTPAGRYSVTLTVSNGCGEDSLRRVITAASPPPEWTVYLPLVLRGYGP